MVFSLKRWPLAVVTVVAACALSVGFAGTAFAQALPGEGNTWYGETINNNQQALTTSNAISQAENGNVIDASGRTQYFFEVWRGATNNEVWMSFNHGPAFSIPGTATYVHPTVVPWGPDRFAIFHVGTNGQIYWTYFDAATGMLHTQWTAVDGQTTRDAVSVTQLGADSEQLYMTYRSANSDNVYGTRFDGNLDWVNTQRIGNGALTPSGPSVYYHGTILSAAIRGENNHVWTGLSFNQGQTWYDFADLGGVTYDSPTIAANSGGAVLVAHRGTDNRVYFRELNVYNEPLTDWQQDTNGYQTLHPVVLQGIGQIIYALITGYNGLVYWKPAWNGNTGL